MEPCGMLRGANGTVWNIKGDRWNYVERVKVYRWNRVERLKGDRGGDPKADKPLIFLPKEDSQDFNDP